MGWHIFGVVALALVAWISFATNFVMLGIMTSVAGLYVISSVYRELKKNRQKSDPKNAGFYLMIKHAQRAYQSDNIEGTVAWVHAAFLMVRRSVEVDYSTFQLVHMMKIATVLITEDRDAAVTSVRETIVVLQGAKVKESARRQSLQSFTDLSEEISTGRLDAVDAWITVGEAIETIMK